MNVTEQLRRDGIAVLPRRFENVAGMVRHLDSCPEYANHVRQRKPPVQGGLGTHPWMCRDMHDVLRAPGWLETALSTYGIAKEYLGQKPLLYSVNVFYTEPQPPAPKADIQGWHRDADDEAFLALFAYLTDVHQPEDGAHEYVLGSQGDEIKNDRDQPAASSRIRQVLGDAGRMFLSDPRGMHRGLVPQHRRRAIAWARWGVSDPPPSYIWDMLEPIPAEQLGYGRYPDEQELRDAIRLVVTA